MPSRNQKKRSKQRTWGAVLDAMETVGCGQVGRRGQHWWSPMMRLMDLLLPSPPLHPINIHYGIATKLEDKLEHPTPAPHVSTNPARTKHLKRTTGPQGVAHRQWTPTSLGRKEEISFMQSTMLRNSILLLPRCGLSLLADSAVVRTAAVNKVPNRDEFLRHLLGHLKETPQQRSSNEMANTIQTVLCRRTKVDFYTDGWPQFTSIAARIRSPTVVDVVLHTSCKERLLELLRDDHTEASLAEYLMKNMKSRDGEPVLCNIISGQMLQMSKDIVISFHERTLICPQGYNIGVLRPKDAEFIHTFWNKSLLDSTKDSIKAFQFMIGSLPNSAIFHTSDPENPVAWVLTYPYGQIGHLHALRDHRRKGLAGIVGVDLFKKVKGEGIIPYVANNNEHVIRGANNLGFVECGQSIRLLYTRVHAPTGSRLVVNYAVTIADPVFSVAWCSYDQAMCEFVTAIQLDPTLAEAHINCGLVFLLHRRNTPRAIECFSQALAVLPTSVVVLLCRAEA
eukprot:Em0014g736a